MTQESREQPPVPVVMQQHGGNMTFTEERPEPIEHPMRRRVIALELAIKLVGEGGDKQAVISVATDFEAYIAGPALAQRLPQVFDGDEEPPVGLYIDRDGDGWTHSSEGWHFRDGNMSQSWETTSRYAPFTRIEE